MFGDGREPLRVCLERSVELAGTRLRLLDWPGIHGPLVHVPDPLSADDLVRDALGAAFAPGYRVVSIEPRAGQPYQIQMVEVLATFEQFGFESPILIGERLGCVAALLIAVWYPTRISRLVLVDPIYTAPCEYRSSIEARALHDCPPDWPSLRMAPRCPILEMHWNDPARAENLQTFLQLP